jgi:hypothetical protein
MVKSFWQFLVDHITVLSGVLGVLVTLLVTGARQWLGRPRLVLSFHDSEAYLSTSTHREVDQQEVTRKYLRVSVKIDGPRFWKSYGYVGAKDCQFYLTGIQRVIAGKPQEDILYDARPVSWPPNNDFKPRNIPRGATMFANVVTMRVDHLGWDFQLPGLYGLSWETRSYSGTFVLTLAATAENAFPSSIRIAASIKADKSGFNVSLFKS